MSDQEQTPSVEMTSPGTKITFTQGKPTQMSCYIGVKLTTLQYENVSYNYGLSMDLIDDPDLVQAEKELTAAVEYMLRPKIKAIRDKYSNGAAS